MRSVLIVTPDISDNSTGRALVWWTVFRELGWRTEVVSAHGSEIWKPLRGSTFAQDCTRIRGSSPATIRKAILDRAIVSDVVIAVKPLPASLGIVLRARQKLNFPLIVDVDDPDLEARLGRRSFFLRVLWKARHFRFWLAVRDFKRISSISAIAVSNPVLQAQYGGRIVSHVRELVSNAQPHSRESVEIAFVGTARVHKGITVLREAVARLASRGVTLTVTADPPDDAAEWERWVGQVPMEEGLRLVASSDIVALPSLAGTFSEGQLPAKLIDAMMHGRAVIVSDIEPMPWAVANSDLVVTPGSADELAKAIVRMCDPVLRSKIGSDLRARAEELFSIEAGTQATLLLVTEALEKAELWGAS